MIKKDFSRFKYNRFNPSVNEWLSSIYNFDRNKLNTFCSNKLIFKLIDSYFNIKLNNFITLKEKKNVEVVRSRQERNEQELNETPLNLNRIFVGLPEIKNSLNSINIVVYVFNKEKILFNIKTTNLQTLYQERIYRNLETSQMTAFRMMYHNNSSKFLKKDKKSYFRLLKAFDDTLYINSINNSRLFSIDKLRKIFEIKLKKRLMGNSNKLYNGYSKSKFYSSLNIINNKLNVFNFFKLYINRLKSFKFNINKNIIKSLNVKIYKWFFNLYIVEEKFSDFNKYKRNFKCNIIDSVYMEKYFAEMREITNKHYYILFFYKRFITRLYFNNLKFNTINLLNLKKIIYKLYNKHININIINLKYLHLDNSMFINAIVRKLKWRKAKVLRVLKNAFITPKIARIDPVYLLRKDLIPQIPEKEKEFSNYLTNFERYLDLKNINKFIFESLKNIHLIGMRLEGKGRLTGRLTASRAAYKRIYKGNLKNVYSSFKKLSAVMSKGYGKSNVNYINRNHHSRLGSYGIKSWQNTM